MSDGEKVYKILKIKGISLHEANKILGFGQGTLHKLVNRKGKMHPSSREKFRRTFNIKEEWWETGKGDLFEEKSSEKKVEEPAGNYSMEVSKRLINAQDFIISKQKEELMQKENEIARLKKLLNNEKSNNQE